MQRDGELITRAGWRARTADELPYIAQARAALARAGLGPPSVKELCQSLGAQPKELDTALKRLVDRGDVVRVSSELYVDGAAMADLERRLVAHLESQGSIDAQGFKELSGQSRKYAIPYAEHFDVKKVTIRIGDRRKLRGR